MRAGVLIGFVLLAAWGYGQGGTWVWVRGSNNLNPVGVYGTQGVGDPANTPGGFYEAAFWRDLQGNFWIFGGLDDNHIETSDLWKYDPINNMWTWVKGPGTEAQPAVYGTMGVPSLNNNPAACGYASHTWTDNNGDLWLWGGYSYDSGTYFGINALWRYNIAANEWTWMKGSTTGAASVDHYGTIQAESGASTPGGRLEGNDDWVDASNNLWFFGGEGNNFGFYNDMWRYDIGTNNWAWMNGPQGTGNAGSYGTEGIESSSNLPPCRGAYTRWQDNAGNFYLFGGINFSLNTNYSDVWKYNTGTNYWTWIAGDNSADATGNYNSYCTDNGKTGPAARYENRTAQAIGCLRTFISFGGFTGAGDNTYNDLWVFDVSTLEWRWANGPSAINGSGNYGILGVPAPGNLPPARGGSCSWMDNAGNFWLFGGMTNGTTGKYNDIWKYSLDSSCTGRWLNGGITATLAHNPICPGDSALLSVLGANSFNIYPSNVASIVDSAHVWLFPDSTTTFIVTAITPCSSNDTVRITLLVNQPGTFNYLVSDTPLCAGGFVSLSFPNASDVSITPDSNVTWPDSSSAQLSPAGTTTYLISAIACGSADTSALTVNVIEPAPAGITISDSVLCKGASIIGTYYGLHNLSANPVTGILQLDSSHILIGPFTSSEALTITGITSCGSPYSLTFHIDVSPSPASPSYTLVPLTICKGDSALLTLNNASLGQSFDSNSISWIDSTHAWLFPDTTTRFGFTWLSYACGASVSDTVTLNVVKPGVADFTLPDTAICSGGYAYLSINGITNPVLMPQGSSLFEVDTADYFAYLYPTVFTTYTLSGKSVCGNTIDTSFTVDVLPVPNPALGSTIICAGDSTTLSLTGLQNVQITPAAGVHWVNGVLAELSPDSTTFYEITGTACNGPYLSDIEVNVVPDNGLNYTIWDTILCPGFADYLTVAGAMNVTLIPTTSGTLFMIDSADYYAYLSPAQTTTFTLTGTSFCTGQTVSASFTVHVDSTWGGMTFSNAISCTGGTTTVTFAGLTNPVITPTNNVTWINSNQALITIDSTTTFQLQGTNPCNGIFDTVFTLSPGYGALGITSNRSGVCPGDTAQLCAAAGFSNYHWNTGANTKCIEVTTPGNYSVSADSGANCQVTSNILTLSTVAAAPVVVSVAGDTFTAYGEVSYEWFLNGQATGDTSATYIKIQAGLVAVLVTDTNGCSRIDTIQIFGAVNEVSATNISIYPNPSTGSWQLAVGNELIGARYEVYNATGQLVLKSEIRNPQSEIELLGVASGVYELRVITREGMVVRKLVKL